MTRNAPFISPPALARNRPLGRSFRVLSTCLGLLLSASALAAPTVDFSGTAARGAAKVSGDGGRFSGVAGAGWQVSPGGAFTYGIDIEIPAGTAGVAPSVGLSYASGAGNGVLGVGWRLTGLPAIAVDVRGDDTRFAYLGSGWSGYHEATDRLVRQGLESQGRYRIKSGPAYEFIAGPSDCGDLSGAAIPCVWTMRDGRGGVWTFGGSAQANTRVHGRDANPGAPQGIGNEAVRGYLLSGYANADGVGYTVDYHASNTAAPTVIRYATEASSFERSVSFTYSNGRYDRVKAPELANDLLVDIAVHSKGQLVHRYALSYNTEVDAQRVLQSVQMLDSNGQASGKAPHDFTYTAPDAGKGTLHSLTGFGHTNWGVMEDLTNYLGKSYATDMIENYPFHESPGDLGIPLEWASFMGDVNGDGYDDLVRFFGGMTSLQDPCWHCAYNATWGLRIQTALGGPHGLQTPDHRSFPMTWSYSDGSSFNWPADWSAELGDVNGDGYADLVIYGVRVPPTHQHIIEDDEWGHSVVFKVALGGPTGLTPPSDQSQSAVGIAIPGELTARLQVRAGDVTGDQRLDFVVFEPNEQALWLVAGSEGGLAVAEAISGDTLSAWAPCGCGDDIGTIDCATFRGARLADINGDGRQDFVAAYARHGSYLNANGAGKQALVYALGDEDGLNATQVRTTALSVDSLQQYLLAGDLNGDGADDLLLTYQGYQGTVAPWDSYANRPESCKGADGEHPTTRTDYVPRGREFLGIFGGYEQNSAAEQTPFGPTLQAHELHVNSNSVYAYPDEPGRLGSIPMVGDITGDGLADLVTFYHGAQGQEILAFIAHEDGSLGSPITYASHDGGLADGPHAYRWTSTLADVNGDRIMDLVYGYYGTAGLYIKVAHGGPRGLGPITVLAGTTAMKAGYAAIWPQRREYIGMQPTSRLLSGDINGDGKADILFVNNVGVMNNATQDGAVRYVLSQSAMPYRVVRATTPLGGQIDVDYEPVTAFTGSMVLNPTGGDNACQGRAGGWALNCGLPNRQARELVYSVTESNGRGWFEMTDYDYANGLFLPGQPDARADLGFQEVITTSRATSQLSIVEYTQRWPFHRRPVRQQTFGDYGAALITQDEFVYDTLQPAGSTLLSVQRVTHRHEGHEPGAGAPTHRRDRHYTYDSVGNVIRLKDVADGHALYTERKFLDAGATWLIHRPERVRTREADGLVIDSQRFIYRAEAPHRLLARQRLLADFADQAYCTNLVEPEQVSTPAQRSADCLASALGGVTASAGQAEPLRWVTVEKDLQYDAFGNLIRSTDALDRVTHQSWDPDFAAQINVRVNALGHQTVREYDYAGRLIATRDVNDQLSITTLDTWGRPVALQGPIGHIVVDGHQRWSYGPQGNPNAQFSDEVVYHDETGNGVLTRTYVDGFGQTFETVSTDGGQCAVRTQSLRVIESGRINTLSSEPLCWINPWASLSGVSQNAATSSTPSNSALGAILQPFMTASSPVTLAAIEAPYWGYHASPVKWTKVFTDHAGRPRQVVRSNQISTASSSAIEKVIETFSYHADGSTTVTDARGFSTRSFVDGRGNVIRRIDANGETTEYLYDGANRLVETIFPHGLVNGSLRTRYDSWGRVRTVEDTLTGVTRTVYDDVGNVLRVTDANSVDTVTVYDALNRPLVVTNGGEVTAYTYDQTTNGIGRLSRVTSPGSTTSYAYDTMGRPTLSFVSIDGVPSRTVERGFDWSGRETLRIFPDTTEQSTRYDGLGRIQDVRVNGVVQASYEDYNARGQMGTRRTADGSVSTYRYNADHLLEGLRTVNSSGAVLQDLVHSYDATANLLSIADERQAQAGPNSCVGHCGGRGSGSCWCDQWCVYYGDCCADHGPVCLDGSGAGAELPGDASATFAYDALGRLTSAQTVSGSASYAYDAQGNISDKEGVSYSYQLGFGPSHTTRLTITGSEGYGQGLAFRARHDAAGNRTSMETNLVGANGQWAGPNTVSQTYTYDGFNRLTQVFDDGALRLSHRYDTAGRRIKKVFHVPFTGDQLSTFYFDDGRFEIRVTDADPGAEATTLHVVSPAGDRIASITTGSLSHTPSLGWGGHGAQPDTTVLGLPEGTVFHHGNHLGSNAVDTDAQGQELARMIYRPYGAVDWSHSTGQDVSTHKYTGQELDEESDLMYYGARFYDPITARFLTADTVLQVAGLDVQGYNRYAYVLGNPLRYVDPTGHTPEEAGGADLPVASQGLSAIESGELTVPGLSDFSDSWDAAMFGIDLIESAMSPSLESVFDVGVKTTSFLADKTGHKELAGALGQVDRYKGWIKTIATGASGLTLGLPKLAVEANIFAWKGILTQTELSRNHAHAFSMNDAVQPARVHERGCSGGSAHHCQQLLTRHNYPFHRVQQIGFPGPWAEPGPWRH